MSKCTSFIPCTFLHKFVLILLKWCGDYNGNEFRTVNCIEDAKRDLQAFNISVTSFATFKYEEDFNMSTIIQCPQYDKRIVTSRVYYRLVLPLSGKQLRFVNITCSRTPEASSTVRALGRALVSFIITLLNDSERSLNKIWRRPVTNKSNPPKWLEIKA